MQEYEGRTGGGLHFRNPGGHVLLVFEAVAAGLQEIHGAQGGL